MSTQDAGQEQLILDMVDRFLEKEVKPFAWQLEHDDEYPAEIVEKMKEMGLFGCLIAPEYGGLGLSTVTYAKIIEHISVVWMSVSGIINSHVIMAAALQRNGTAAQKQAFLPRFATGELRGGIALTEPDCGTDLQAIRTTAVRDGDNYIINGNKMWISNGIYGNCFAVLVKTDLNASPRHKGVGVAQAAQNEAVKYSQQRKTFGKQICEHQAIQLKLGDMATRTEASRLLTMRAAEAYDRGERCDMEAGMAKLFATESALENSMEAMRIHGGYGYSKEYLVERFYRDAPLLTIGEGTNEMQRIIIAKQLIARNPI